MNKTEFMNAVAKQAEAVIQDDKMCLAYVIIKSQDCINTDLWKFYNTDHNIMGLVEMLVVSYSTIVRKKEGVSNYEM